MPRTRNSTSARGSGEVSTVGGVTTIDGREDSGRFMTLFIVIVSLLFVAIFGGALVGGVVSGDPTNGFFITIIAASGVAISIAILVSLRYYCKQRSSHPSESEDHLDKDIRGTFSGSDEEHLEEGDYFEERRHSHGNHRHTRQYRNHGRTPVESHIKEIRAARSFAGEMSALSPHSYDAESMSTRKNILSQTNKYAKEQQERRGLFDFSSVATSQRSPQVHQAREDPPEGAGQATYHAAWILRGQSQDPDAHIFNEDGEIVSFDEIEANRGIEEAPSAGLNSYSDHSIPSPQSTRSRYEVDGDENELSRIPEDESVAHVKEPKKEQTNSSNKETSSKSSESRSRSSRSRENARRSRSRSRSRSKSPFKKTSKKEKVSKKMPPRPTSTKSAAVISTTAAMKKNIPGTTSAPSTPVGSDAGSIASSLFKPFSSVFGKRGNKYASSEAGQSDVSSTVAPKPKNTSEIKSSGSTGAANEGRPPVMPGKQDRVAEKPKGRSVPPTEERYAPSTPGNKSVWSVPPPRRVPSTPGGASAIFSEFQSVADTGVASSTFDPTAHERALRKMQTIQASLGANALDDGSSMPVYYDDDDKASSVAPSSVVPNTIGYDVFAPAGAIGIVVDTTKKGCIVHSLKKTSPMQGLMNPGDLIIALDDFDVRKMNAASLTKLMAKKSQQPERKFTLVPADYV